MEQDLEAFLFKPTEKYGKQGHLFHRTLILCTT